MNESEIVLKLAEQAIKAKEPDYLGDLIKIGLPIIGTVIGGVIGFFATRKAAELNHDTQIKIASLGRATELEKEFYTRRIVRLDELVNCLDDFNQCVIDYCTDIKNWIIHKNNGNIEKADETKDRIKSSEACFYESFLPLLNAEAKLLILGHHELQAEFRAFGEYAQSVYKAVHTGNTKLTTDEVNNHISTLKEKRKALYTQIGEHEMREHNKALNSDVAKNATPVS